MPSKIPFPDYSQLQTKAKIADLERLAESDLTQNEYICGGGMARLLAGTLQSYSGSLSDPLWNSAPSSNAPVPADAGSICFSPRCSTWPATSNTSTGDW